jgi:hypothetical protein
MEARDKKQLEEDKLTEPKGMQAHVSVCKFHSVRIEFTVGHSGTPPEQLL